MSDNELDSVRAKAAQLGVKYHQAQKAETIQANIDAFLATQGSGIPEQIQADPLKEALALFPITVTSMDPADTGIPCVTVSVGNRRLGQITKVLPFGTKWYMPKILIDELKSKRFIRNSMVPKPNGGERLDSQTIPKYAILEHPLPTPAELQALAELQLKGNELAK